MESDAALLLWAGFLGAWMLVAGPIYQASIELSEFEDKHHSLVPAHVPAPRLSGVSPWWWLLPPVGYLLQTRRARRQRDAAMRTASKEAVETYGRYSRLAIGWITVAAGAFLIAVKETGELVGRLQWPTWLIWIVVPGMLLIAASFTALSVRRRRRRSST